MGKVTKILGNIISAVILLLIFIPMFVALIVELPPVQNYIIDKLTTTLTERTGVKVDVGHVNINLLGQVAVDDFYVEDLQHDTLIYAKRVKTSLANVIFRNGPNGIVLKSGQVAGMRLFLRETPEGVMNIKQVLDRINKKKKAKKPFQVNITDVEMKDSYLVIERREHRNPEYGIDYGNMRIDKMSARVESFFMQGTVVKGSVKEFRGVEQSGFEVKSMTGDFRIDVGLVDLRDMCIKTENSTLNMERLVLKGDDWSEYKYFIHNVPMDGVIRQSHVTTDDVAYFAPKMRTWKSEMRDADIDFNGLVSDLTVDVKSARLGDVSSLRGNVYMLGLPDVKNTSVRLNLEHLVTNRKDAMALFSGITQKELPAKVVDIMQRAGRIEVKGTFNGGLQSFVANADVVTSKGKATLSANKMLQPRQKDTPRYSTLLASANVEQLDLGELLAVNILGDVSAYLSFDGTVREDRLEGGLQADIATIGFNSRNYQDIVVDGNVLNKSFRGSVHSYDSALRMSLSGVANLNEEKPVYDMLLDVQHADLRRMNINRRDSLSQISMAADLYAVGENFDDMNGNVTVRDVVYRYNADTLTAANVNLTARYVGEQRSLSLVSEFLDATFTGPTRYTEVLGYLRAAMHKYLPGLPSFTHDYVATGNEGYSALSLNVKNINPLLDAITHGLQLAESSQMNFMINPSSNHIAMRLESEYLEKGDFFVGNIKMNVNNEGDSLSMYLHTDDIYAGMINLPNLSIVAGAKNDVVGISALSNSEIDSMSAALSLRARLGYNEQKARKLTVDVFPTSISRGGNTWDIHRSRIELDSSRINVQNFKVSNKAQELLLNGVASRSTQDSLTLTLRDFSLTPFAAIIERMGYHLKGYGNGEATMKAVLDKGELNADIRLEDMSVNDVPIAPMKLNSRWDFKDNRARVKLRNMRNNSDVVTGFYVPSTGRYYAEGTFDKIPMMMIDSMLRGVVSSTEGMATAKLTIQGKGRQADLNGEVNVSDLATTVDFTKVTYYAPSAHIDIKHNHLLAKGVKVYDEEKNVGTYDMDVSLEHLSNISFNVRVEPRKMIVLNTTEADNDLFYGKLYASGSADIVGSKSGTRLDLSGSTEGNSHFYMPLSSKTDVSAANFVIFEKPGMQVDTTSYLLRKKMMFERRHRRASSAAGNMEINIELQANTNTEAQLVIDPTVGDIIKARGEGTLNLRVVPNANIFVMSGDYRISEGSYLFTLQNIVNKLFKIEEGSTIQWTGDPLDARLDINAIYNLRASLQPLLASTTLDNVTRAVPVECIINLTDRLSNPTVLFDIKVPNADSEIQAAVANLLNNQQSIATQFMYLLVSGSFYSDQTSSSAMGANASAMTGFELLSNQVSNWLSSDDYNIVLRYRPRSELTSDEIDIGFSKSLVNNRLLVELEGNYMVDNKMAANSNMSNFMGEAYITWLIDQSGSMKLRGFTQTIDRFDENQGLQETGLGIYYKEDFNNLADLRRRVKERFMSKKRRDARDEALEAMQNGEPYDTLALMSRKELRQIRRQEKQALHQQRDSIISQE